MNQIDLKRYLVIKENRTGRKRFDSETLLKVILFALMYQCEDCTGCLHKERCCKCEGNRIVRLNEELTNFHQEVLDNLNSTHGALLRMNRSIQAEGAFGTIKWNRDYKRARRRGLKGVIFELSLISCSFNLHKYHLKKLAKQLAA